MASATRDFHIDILDGSNRANVKWEIMRLGYRFNCSKANGGALYSDSEGGLGMTRMCAYEIEGQSWSIVECGLDVAPLNYYPGTTMNRARRKGIPTSPTMQKHKRVMACI